MMRLNEFEIEAIKTSFKEYFKKGEVYLFGSRLDDTQKGGDIDLYIKTDQPNKVRKKVAFLASLKEKIGDQKIDVVLNYDATSPIEQTALAHGKIICKF